MLIICEPRFTYVDEDNEEVFVVVDEVDVENQVYLRKQIEDILTDLFPDKIGDLETIGKSFYGITVYESDDIDEELQKMNEYNAEKNEFEMRYKGKTRQTTLELFTFMNRGQYAKDMVLTTEEVKEIQHHGVDLSGLQNKLDSMFLTSADLSGATFNGSSINSSNFNDTLLVATQFVDTTIKETHFDEADMRYADFGVATLSHVSFVSADLRYAIFMGATLTNVDFTGADLSYADLTGVTLDGNCNFSGATFVNLANVLNGLAPYPQRLFDGAIDIEEEGEGEGEGEGDEEEMTFLAKHKAIFSSADVKIGEDVPEEEEEEEDDEFVNNKPPICADVINGYDINIETYLQKNDANFTIQLPNSDKYECVNLNDIKKYHIKSDKSGSKFFNYVYACKGDTPYFAFTENDYIRAKAYIRMGSFNLIVEKPDWFPGSPTPIYRKFKLVKTGSQPSFVSETMLRHGEQGDEDYISSEWHCNVGKMDTYRLEPLLEGGRRKKKRQTHKKQLIKKRTHKKQINKKKTHQKQLNKKKTHQKQLNKKKTHKKTKKYKKI